MLLIHLFQAMHSLSSQQRQCQPLPGLTAASAQAQKPEPVSRAEQMGGGDASCSVSMGDNELVQNIVAFQVAIARYGSAGILKSSQKIKKRQLAC